ncbi:winged helix-turn-helix domain-containing protein [Pseudonocardia spirodelae]|uniref:Winged helix-turn-helix domain-containing protein n=1 Tax=Pseudonocardia spirodelae TaxID=3133431 RepID=A0ABU8T954_9PSEU
MALTSRHVLRSRILKVLLENQGRALTRKQVLDRLRSQHDTSWTEEDVTPPPSRPFETKWENNASFERANMVREGLLEAGGDGHWVLTASGAAHARKLAEQLTLIGDLAVDNRGYAELRAGQLLLDVSDQDDGKQPEAVSTPAPAAELEQISEVPFEAVAAAVPLENSQTFDYAIAAKEAASGIKEEAKLVERFAAHLEGKGHEIGRFKICPPGDDVTLYTDLFDVTANRLYEAKGTSDRVAVRMAIGQLLDYSRHINPTPKLAVLIPRTPTEDLLNLLSICGIECVYEADEGGFTEVSGA